MLRMRLLVAFLLIVPLLALLAADFFLSGPLPGVWLLPLGLTIALLAAEEMVDMFRATGAQPVAWTVYAGVALVLMAAYAPTLWSAFGEPYPITCPFGQFGWTLAAAAVAVGLVFFGEIARYPGLGNAVQNVALAVLAIVYVGIPMAFIAQLRVFEGNRWGMAALVSVVFVTKLSDVGAYATGRLLGRHKMTPRLSPGKTWEGFVGGLIAASLAAIFYFQIVSPGIVGSSGPHAPWWGAVVFGTLVALVGMLGDLSASLIKRDAQRKNSSSWMPGLGGILDVVDSVLMAAAPGYVCWLAGIVGPGV